MTAQTPAVGVATLTTPGRSPRVRKGKVKVGVSCSATGACTGTLALRGYSDASPFFLLAGKTGSVTVRLNAKARAKLKRKGAGLTVKAMLANTAGAKSTLRFKIRH